MLDLRSGPRGVLLASSLVVMALFAACSQGHRSPTEPELAAASASALAPTAAASGNGNGGNGGHGGGNGGNGGNGGGSSALHLDLQPNVWNTNWAHSNGTVSALLEGSGLDKIDLTSIQLVGNASAAKPVSAVRASREGNHVRAFFRQSDAIGSLDHPKPGDVVTVMVKLTQGGQSQTLSTQVRIVGPNGGGEGGGGDDSGLSAEIQPNHWNVNFAHTSGTVTALIEGPHLDQIDLKSIVLLGTDPAAKPLPATRADHHGNHVRAFFSQKDAFLTLLKPQPGHTYTVKIELQAAGKTVDLNAKIQVVGPSR